MKLKNVISLLQTSIVNNNYEVFPLPRVNIYLKEVKRMTYSKPEIICLSIEEYEEMMTSIFSIPNHYSSHSLN